jgi:3D (Asp-Asp-Asp) domain-containing protein
MKPYLPLIAALSLSGCAEVATTSRPATHTIARITYYSAHEDKFGSRTANGGRAHEGVTCAAAPWHPFGTKVIIPKLAGLVGEGKFVVQDRGSAVTSERASHQRAEVFDIFLAGTRNACKRRMIELSKRVGYYTEVILE